MELQLCMPCRYSVAGQEPETHAAPTQIVFPKQNPPLTNMACASVTSLLDGSKAANPKHEIASRPGSTACPKRDLNRRMAHPSEFEEHGSSLEVLHPTADNRGGNMEMYTALYPRSSPPLAVKHPFGNSYRPRIRLSIVAPQRLSNWKPVARKNVI